MVRQSRWTHSVQSDLIGAGGVALGVSSVTKKKVHELEPTERRPFTSRVSEAAIFTGMILLTSLAIIAVAVAAPIILGLTALAGFISRKGRARRWRPVGA